MPNAFDLASVIAPTAINALLQRRAAGSATRTLTGGVDNASGTIRSNAAELQKIYNDERSRQNALLQPWMTAGTTNAAMLNAGLAPGGGLADPYGQTFTAPTADEAAATPGYQFTLAEGNKAIEAARRAMGTRFSGGAVKEAVGYNVNTANQNYNDVFNRGLTTFQSNENTFRQNQADRYNRLKAAADAGYAATTADISSGQNYVGESGATKLVTGQQLADLQQQKSEAEAAGDLGKANTIQNAIESGLAGLQGLRTIDALKGLGGITRGAQLLASVQGGAVPAIPLAGTGLSAGTQSALGVGLSSPALAGGGVPAGIGAVGTGAIGTGATAAGTGAAAAGTGATAAGTATGGGGAGLGASTVAFFTNPVTIGIGAGLLAGALILKKSQVHPTADKWTSATQTPFGQNLTQVVNGFDRAIASGQLSKAEAQSARDQTAQLIQQFEQAETEFAKKGSKQKTVIDQSRATMASAFGADWSGILRKMDTAISSLPA